MSEEGEKKSYRYLVTLRWYIETDEELVPGADETDKKIIQNRFSFLDNLILRVKFPFGQTN